MAKLFNISEAANIATHCLALIAKSGGSMRAAEISGKLNFSKNHVSRVLLLLVRHKLLDSVRGPKGGFSLSAQAPDKSLFDVIELIDGKFEVQGCRHKKESCPFDACIYGNQKLLLFEQFKAFYSKRKIKELSS